MKIPGFSINISINMGGDLQSAARGMLKDKIAPVGKPVMAVPTKKAKMFNVNEDPYPKLTQSKHEPSPGPGMKEKPKRGYFY
jgi:hypothetical protein